MKIKSITYLVIIILCFLNKIYSQSLKFIVDELKLGMYYTSDTSNKKEVFYLNDKLKKINNEKLTDGTIFYGDYANVRKGNKYGFMDKNGIVTLFPNYTNVVWTNSLLGVALKDNKIGYIDRKGNVKIPFKYDLGTFFYDNQTVVREGLKYFLLNNFGDSILSSENIIFPPEGNSLIPFVSDKGQGMISKDKKIVIEPIYRNLINIGGEFIKATNSSKSLIGILNTKGETVIPFDYDEIKIANLNDFFPAKKNGKWGFINIKNETIIEFLFDEAFFFSEDLAAVVIGKKTGFINKKGKIIIEPKFDFSWNFGINYSFKNGISAVLLNGKWGFANKKGELVIQPIYDYVSCFLNKNAIVGINKKYGIISDKGAIIIPLDNDKIHRSENGIFKVVKGMDKFPEDNAMENIKDVLLLQTLTYLFKN